MFKYAIFTYLIFLNLICLAQNPPILAWETLKYVKSINAKGSEIRTDKDGNVFMITTQTEQNPFVGYFLVKYDAQGKELWTRYYHGPFSNLYGGFVVDSLGNAYVGCGYNIGAGGPEYDAVLTKYFPNGDVAWSTNLSAGYGGDAQVRDIAIDTMGNLYAVCELRGIGSEDRVFVVRLDAESGLEYWRRETKAASIVPLSIRLFDDRFLVFCVGETSSQGLFFRIVQWGLWGNLISDHTKPYLSANANPEFHLISSNGDLVLGNRWRGFNITRVNFKGDTLWTYSLPPCDPCRVLGLAEDDSLAVYATGSWLDNDIVRLTTAKLRLDGALAWQNIYQNSQYLTTGSSIAVDDRYAYTIGTLLTSNAQNTLMQVVVHDKTTGKPIHDIQVAKPNVRVSGYHLIPTNQGFCFTALNTVNTLVHISTGCYDFTTGIIPSTSKEDGRLLSLPNPVHNTATLLYDAFESGEAYLFFHDAQGKLLGQKACHVEEGRNLINLESIASWPQGIFHISLQTLHDAQHIRIVKQ